MSETESVRSQAIQKSIDFVEKLYENGDLYFGQLKDDKKEGLGQMIYKNGDFYLGNWS